MGARIHRPEAERLLPLPFSRLPRPPLQFRRKQAIGETVPGRWEHAALSMLVFEGATPGRGSLPPFPQNLLPAPSCLTSERTNSLSRVFGRSASGSRPSRYLACSGWDSPLLPSSRRSTFTTCLGLGLSSWSHCCPGSTARPRLAQP
jgi:hypothetical protein